MTRDATLQRRIPLYPTFAPGLRGSINDDRLTGGVFDSGHLLWMNNARSALQYALQSLPPRAGAQVLLPAYQCPVMVYPILAAGLEPVYYRIRPDCSIDYPDLEQKLGDATQAVIAVHYFGFPSSLGRLRQLCNQRGLLLIEDCAHAFFGAWDEPVGSVGDIAIASLYKFFPAVDGGGLRFNTPPRQLPGQSRCPLFSQLRSMLNTLEQRDNPQDPNGALRQMLRTKDWLWQRLKAAPPAPQPLSQDANQDADQDDPSNPFTRDNITAGYSTARMPLFSHLVYRLSSRRQLVERRRQNYTYLVDKLSGPALRPLFPVLPNGIVPYNLPLVSRQASRLAARLRSHGVSVARFSEFFWEETARRACDVADEYASHCIQLPIHQSLRQPDLDYIASLLIGD